MGTLYMATGYFHEKFIMAENKSRYNVLQLGI